MSTAAARKIDLEFKFSLTTLFHLSCVSLGAISVTRRFGIPCSRQKLLCCLYASAFVDMTFPSAKPSAVTKSGAQLYPRKDFVSENKVSEYTAVRSIVLRNWFCRVRKRRSKEPCSYRYPRCVVVFNIVSTVLKLVPQRRANSPAFTLYR
jgi:hypothetical protein